MSESDLQATDTEREQIEDDIERLNLALQEEEVNLQSDVDEEIVSVAVSIEDYEDEPRPGPSGVNRLSTAENFLDLRKDDDQLDISNYEVVDSCRGIPVTTDTCLALNRAYQEILLDFLHQIEVALTDNRNKQYTLEEGLNETSQIKNTKTGGKPLTSFASPYFKDANDSFPPENDDQKMKVILKEHRQDFRSPVPWYKQQREMLEKAVVREALQVKIRPFMNRKELQCEKFLEADKNDKKKEKKEIEEKIAQIDKDIAVIKNMPKAELLKDVDMELIDWLKIANSDFQGKKDKDDCYKMWNNVMRPDINKDEWIPEEVELLKDLVAEHKMCHWVKVAEKLGTGRTPYQCLQYYQQNLNDAYNNGEWDDEEDELLAEVVENCRTENRIPWHQVSYFIEGRSAQQCSTRWNQINPQLKHGKWSEEEDCLLLSGITLYGTKDWTKISSVVLGRNAIQCRDRYMNCLDPTLKPPSVWTYEEDKVLLKAVLKHTLPDKNIRWIKVAAEVEGRTDHMVLSRYKRLMSWKAKCDWIDSLDEETQAILGSVTVKKNRLPEQKTKGKGKQQKLNASEKKQDMALSLAEEVSGVQREDYLKQQRDKAAGDIVVPRPPLCYRYSPRSAEYAWKQKIQLKKLVEDHLLNELKSPNSMTVDKINLPAKTACEFQPYFKASKATKRNIEKLLQCKHPSNITVSQLLKVSKDLRQPEKRTKRKKQRIEITKQIIDVLSRKKYINMKTGRGRAGRPKKHFISHPQTGKSVFEDQLENVGQLTTVSAHLMMTALQVNGRTCLDNATRWNPDKMPDKAKEDMAFLKKLFPPIPPHLQKKTTSTVPAQNTPPVTRPVTITVSPPVSAPSLNVTPVPTSESTVTVIQDGSNQGRQPSISNIQVSGNAHSNNSSGITTQQRKRKLDSKVLPKVTATLESKKRKVGKGNVSLNKESVNDVTEVTSVQEKASNSKSEQSTTCNKTSDGAPGTSNKPQIISVKSLDSIPLKPGQRIVKLGAGGSGVKIVKEGEKSVLKTKSGDIELKPGQKVVKLVPQTVDKTGTSKPEDFKSSTQVAVSLEPNQGADSQEPKQMIGFQDQRQVTISQDSNQMVGSKNPNQVADSQELKQMAVSQDLEQVKQKNVIATNSRKIIFPNSGKAKSQNIPMLPPSVKSLEGFSNLLLQRKLLTNRAGRNYNARFYQRRVSQLIHSRHLSERSAQGKVDEEVDATLSNTFQVFKERGSRLVKKKNNRRRPISSEENSLWTDPLENIRNSSEFELLKKRFQGLFVWPALLSTIETNASNKPGAKQDNQESEEIIKSESEAEDDRIPELPSVTSNMTPTQAAVIKQSDTFFKKIKKIIKKYPRKTYACAHSKTYYQRQVRTKEWKASVLRKRQLAMKLKQEGILQKKTVVNKRPNKYRDVEKRKSLRLANRQMAENLEKAGELQAPKSKEKNTPRKTHWKKRSIESDKQKLQMAEHLEQTTAKQAKHSDDSEAVAVKEETTDDVPVSVENNNNSSRQPVVMTLESSTALLQNFSNQLMMLQQGGLLPMLTQQTGALLNEGQQQKDGTSIQPDLGNVAQISQNESPVTSTGAMQGQTTEANSSEPAQCIPTLSGHVLLAVPVEEFMKGMGNNKQGLLPLSLMMNPNIAIPEQETSQTLPVVNSNLPVIAVQPSAKDTNSTSSSNIQESEDKNKHNDNTTVTKSEKEELSETLSCISKSSQPSCNMEVPSTDTGTRQLSRGEDTEHCSSNITNTNQQVNSESHVTETKNNDCQAGTSDTSASNDTENVRSVEKTCDEIVKLCLQSDL